MANVGFYDHTTPVFKELSILKIPDIYKLECLKFIQSQQQDNLFIFHRAADTHNINTINRHNLRPPFPKTESQKRFVIYFGALKWNELPENKKKILITNKILNMLIKSTSLIIIDKKPMCNVRKYMHYLYTEYVHTNNCVFKFTY